MSGTGPEATHHLGLNYEVSENWQVGLSYTDAVDSLYSKDGSIFTIRMADDVRLRERQLGIKSTYYFSGIENGTWFCTGQLQGGRTDLQYSLQSLHQSSASFTWTFGAVIAHFGQSMILTTEFGYRKHFHGDTFTVQEDDGVHQISHSTVTNLVGALNLGINF
jgi:hypothetical protein